MRQRPLIIVAAAFAVAVLALLLGWPRKRLSAITTIAPGTDPAYASTVQPIFDRRCVVCHSCFDAPCQLNLQSFEGLDRGANVTRVYEPSRLEAIHPTRMFQDAQSTTEWQERFGFFPVVKRESAAAGAPEGSLLWRLIEQRRRAPIAVSVDVDRRPVCPSQLSAVDAELRSDPGKGMPYGFPPLQDVEARSIERWLRDGAGGPPARETTDASRSAIAQWEAFLNASDSKTRIVARYVYEHLFLAHLAFDRAPGEWFRLVRSRTESPWPIDEMATVRPYDDPGASRVFYRFRRVVETIVEKTHAAYLLGDAKLARLRHIFFDAEWSERTPRFPSYDVAVAANPFVAFASIPAAARYQFLLDDAYYHVETFIHGPVCKGQVALNVIDEHFLIFFLAPSADLTITHPEFLRSVTSDLAVPALGGDGLEAAYARFKLHDLAYLRHRSKLLLDVARSGHSMTDIWDGDGTNPGAVLTVYRHFDSASVVYGAVGGVPKTAWVLDYPIFERLYYDLVAGFDVFGSLIHQVSTRRYMNLLRIEAESSFLGFLPVSQRRAVRDSWYRPVGVSDIVDVLDPAYSEPETQVAYSDPTHAKNELVRRLVTERLPREVVRAREPVQWDDVAISGDDAASRFERAARRIVRTADPFVGVFPDATLVRLRTGTRDDAIYTIVRNKEHLNIDFMFFEDAERAPAEDTLHVVRGVAASRPNLFLVVDDPEGFVTDVAALGEGDATWSRFLDRYGVRRRNAEFWAASDFFNDRYEQLDPTAAGILDLSRYTND